MKIKKWILFSLLFFIFTSEVKASNGEIVITEIPPSGMIINSPGTYVFGNDITWIPNANGQALLIQSKDVTLDLKNHQLKSTTTAFNTTGIVALLSENLTIKNGTLSNLAYRGIDCTACSKITIKHITVDGLNIENTAVYTVPVGILISASDEALVDKCKVKNINVRTGSCAAIQMTGTTDSKIWNCQISNLLNRDGACTGIGHLLCDRAEVKSCELDGLNHSVHR